jgi:hypothetical protein
MECGLREVEGSDTLQRGCLVAGLNPATSPRLEFVVAGE